MGLRAEIDARLQRLELPFSADGVDRYGVSKTALRSFYLFLGWLYRHYFSVRVHNIDAVPERGRAMLIGNHSGGVATDAGIVIAACFFEMNPPRLAHGMAEKFLIQFPFASRWTTQTGHLTGLPEHALRLLNDDRLLLVFPEGARGTAKLYPERNSLVRFGTGFVRLALQTGTPIIPFGFVGGGDAVPTVANAYRLGKLLGVPYVPLTPWLLPLPVPVRMALHFGDAMRFDGNGTEDDEVIEGYVEQVKTRIANLIDTGLADLAEDKP